ncbi:hypothetical protein ElyMa_002841200 [Elysia marginata]|uniref:Uncharacterized protein n=1 Tax=Elysia marginata TaxID=1093978 RepID=A0AAV4HTV3_9GAST|nr:hypothetical protein ElyMa_002841200 [Elysia marginata]
MEMGWPRSETSRQPLDPKSHRMATTERKKITRITDAKMARRYRTVERNHLETRCQTAATMAGQCGGLHLAVDEESLVEKLALLQQDISTSLQSAQALTFRILITFFQELLMNMHLLPNGLFRTAAIHRGLMTTSRRPNKNDARQREHGSSPVYRFIDKFSLRLGKK